ncbi:MAG: hypothetical protein EOM68_28080, partial [Spirochaetia bacterium]|nr:hypothetical protein [Spirochaetia bacterium]
MLNRLEYSDFEESLDDQGASGFSKVPVKAVEPIPIPSAPLEESLVVEPAPVVVKPTPITEPEIHYTEDRPVEQAPKTRESIPEAVVIKAVGTGLTENEARSDALAALSGILYSKVSSSIETTEKVNEIAGIEVANTSSFSENISVSTNLPILGASYSLLPKTIYDVNRKAYLYQVEVMMSDVVSLPLYEVELARLASFIGSAGDIQQTGVDSLAQEASLLKLLDAYLEFERFSYVARALGSRNIPVLSQTRYSIETKLRQVEKIVDSYTKAARNLTKGVDRTGVYVYPAKLNNSGGVTEFA